MSVMGTYDKDGSYTLSIDEFNIVTDFACFLVSAEDAARWEMIRTLYNQIINECKFTSRSKDDVIELFEVFPQWNKDDPTLFDEVFGGGE